MTRQTVSIGVAILLAAIACRKEPVDTRELLSANYIGQGALRKGQLEQAEEQFKKVVSLAPKDPLGHANLGLTYLRAGRYADAEAALRRARRLNPASPEVGLILARLYSLTDRSAEARKTLEDLRPDAKVLYALAELDARDTAQIQRYEQRLRQVLPLVPANLAVRLKLADVLVRRGETDSAVKHLEEVRRLRPEPPREARPFLDTTIQRLRAGDAAGARATMDRFLRLMELTSPYQAALDEVKWLEGPILGRPVLAFNPQTLIATRGLISARPPAAIHFTDVTSEAGFPSSSAAVAALAIGDYDGDAADDFFVGLVPAGGGTPSVRLYHVQRGYVADVTERMRLAALLPAGAAHAIFADADNDGWLDLFAIGTDGRGYLLRNAAGSGFENVTAKAGLGNVGGGAHKALFLDADHDGDLDLLVVGTQTRLYRNNLDGTFTDAGTAAGVPVDSSRDAAFGDFDGDGRIDLVVARTPGNALLLNTGMQRFRDATASSGFARGAGSEIVAVGDYDNDGWLDVVAAGSAAGTSALWRNTADGAGTFERDARSAGVLQRIGSIAPTTVQFVDYDNDGWLDLLALGQHGALLLHNSGNGTFDDRTSAVPATTRSASAAAVSDVDGDGDQDLVVGNSIGPTLLRNDGGNARMAMRVQLVGLRTGSGKNNTFGVGARIEVRAGEIYQTRVVTDRVTHFGLGSHLKADVVRIQWTNGVPETIYFPGTDQDVLELEQLKGSCAFLYTWDGKAFRFVTDVMWRSALGMPLGLMGGGRGAAYAPAGASREFIRIPGDALQPRDGRYVLQITEELWETAYLDEIKLLAVDHPDSIDVFVDERFPPASEQLRLFQVANPRIPSSAVDDKGGNVLPALREKDDTYVSNLTPLHYQGVVEPHDLVLDLGADAGRSGAKLFLRGWIYPTDASINVALAQQSKVQVRMPSLEVRNARGQWEMAIDNIGFPSGKDKTIVVDLNGRFPTADHRVRIRTNMQIYWDHAFVAVERSENAVATRELRPVSADLHRRGFSRMYRRGGRYGPHWFAYADVSKDSPWRLIEGAFTRFGDVLPLLGRPDDMYVVMAPGDEATIEFDAAPLGDVRPGWKRTFLLYTDGWIKDADLNTAFGNSVEPLPFHAMKEYPYTAGESYPSDSTLLRYRREYNTRVITRR